MDLFDRFLTIDQFDIGFEWHRESSLGSSEAIVKTNSRFPFPSPTCFKAGSKAIKILKSFSTFTASPAPKMESHAYWKVQGTSYGNYRGCSLSSIIIIFHSNWGSTKRDNRESFQDLKSWKANRNRLILRWCGKWQDDGGFYLCFLHCDQLRCFRPLPDGAHRKSWLTSNYERLKRKSLADIDGNKIAFCLTGSSKKAQQKRWLHWGLLREELKYLSIGKTHALLEDIGAILKT